MTNILAQRKFPVTNRMDSYSSPDPKYHYSLFISAPPRHLALENGRQPWQLRGFQRLFVSNRPRGVNEKTYQAAQETSV
jgi:hypothetical protein